MKKIAGLMRKVRGEGGFSLVELLLVIAISFIMMGAMVGMVTMAYSHFYTHKSLQAVNDSSRRLLNTMSRQLRDSLQFNNTDCTASKLGFWADIDNDNPNATVNETDYLQAEYVTWTRSGTSVVQSTTQQAGDPEGAGTSTANIGSGLKDSADGLRFSYFKRGDDTAMDPPDHYNINKDVGRIRISIQMLERNIARTYYQDVFLRVFDRVPEGTWCTISSLSIDHVHVPAAGTNTYPGVTITGIGTHFNDDDPVPANRSVGEADTNEITVTITSVTDATHCTATITVTSLCSTGDHSIWVRTGNEDPGSVAIQAVSP